MPFLEIQGRLHSVQVEVTAYFAQVIFFYRCRSHVHLQGSRDEGPQPIREGRGGITGRCVTTTKYQLQWKWKRLKAAQAEGEADARGKSHFHVWFKAQAAASDMFVSFHLKYGGGGGFIYFSWLRCMQGRGRWGRVQVLWKQQGFTMFHTASEVLHQAFTHAYIQISSHKEMSGVTKSFWPS